jgi:hypothetical protein
MTIAYFTGLETGDASEIVSLAAGASVQSTTVRTGAYALKVATAACALKTGLAATQSVFRTYFQFPALPAGNTPFITESSVGAVARFTVVLDTDGTLRLKDTGVTLGLANTPGTTVLSPGVWYRVETALDLAAGGVCKLWINGNLELNLTHTSNVSATTTDGYAVNGTANPNEYFFDDIRIDTATLTPPGEGRTIARQGKTGTPTYDAWTKVGGATAAINWSETPFSATNSCTSAVAAQAQTMLISSFSATQAGHGGQCIQAMDTINACKVSVIAKEASAGSPSIRRRLNGADTDVVITLTTSDAYYDSGIWTDTLANLNGMEAGGLHAAGTLLTTFEDVWVMVDFTDQPWAQSVM